MLDQCPTETWGTTRIQRFAVAYEYPVVFTRDVFDPANPVLAEILRSREPAKRHRVAVFVDDGVSAVMPRLARSVERYAAAHAASMAIAGDIVPVPGGERIKNDPDATAALIDVLRARAIDRHSYVLAIGGGAVLDAVGYAAAIFHRGVRHVRLPTTVLAQADSGVGVKNAVNAYGTKNLVGTFAPPFAVINDGVFIDRLPARDKRGGMAEAVKVALIRDGDFFQWLERHVKALGAFDPNGLDILIQRTAALHMRQIAQGGDPFETGSARPLDYGHWSAHKLETLTQYGLTHGEAVAIGVALDARYSTLAGLLPAGDDVRVCRLLRGLGFALWHEALQARDGDGRLAILNGLRDFQEHLGGELTITLLAGIGRGVEVHEIDHALVEQAVAWLGREWRS
ncbi:MAG TPA: 3-dehydroquinate synthase [Beijerinckiaceae bacterium]|nr:3-dehydroquinate synthase [Beijerinckiaceae bacterium]